MKKIFLLLLLSQAALSQQNTILIIADDVSPAYFGMYATADTASTPNFRAMANNGVLFNKVWAYPICSPTRASLFTGRYGFRTGMGAVVAGPTTNQLSTTETSIATLLRTQTSTPYATACIGKWHLHAKPGNLNNPSIMGYQLYSGSFAGAIPDYYNYERVRNGSIDTVTTYATTQSVNDAIAWLDTVPSAQPFFLWMGFNAPHDPYHKPPNNLITNPALPGTLNHINNNKSTYFKAAIEALDSEFGRLVQYLDNNNLLDSTNFIFMGDNGSPNDVSQNPINNRSKATIYDYGVHVPMFISGPAVNNPGRVNDELVTTVDLFATIAELSGVNNMNPNNVTLDSRSLVPYIKDQTATPRGYIFSEQFGVSATKDGKSIRNADYHLLRFDAQAEEFYHIAVDPTETNNLLLTSNMTATDIANYHALCDSLNSLLGTGSCLPLVNDDLKTADNRLSIYPNPVLNNLSMKGNDHVVLVKIFNSLGSLILQEEVEPNATINLATLANGSYYLKTEDGQVLPFTKQ